MTTMYDENFEILVAVYGDDAYRYVLEWLHNNHGLHFTPAQAAAEIVKEEGFENVLENIDDGRLSYYDRNSGLF